jgi:hypothetical protein
MELNHYDLSIAIDILSKADGEDIQFIIWKIGMSEQLLRQLVVNASDLELENCIEERKAKTQYQSIN